jgi:protocatechuate 3,4-dioxygenase beta subunit
MRAPARRTAGAHGVSRREALALLGAASATALFGCGSDDDARAAPDATPTPAAAPTAAPVACVVTPEQTEGPYFVDERLERSDLTAGTGDPSVVTGVPLRLVLDVLGVRGGTTCAPLAGAQVDLWHCDAIGRYSGIGADGGQSWLRGYQNADAAGRVAFTTIYPGWYPGRAVHVHFKVRVFAPSGDEALDATSQLYFPDDASDDVLARAPYAGRAGPRVRNEDDAIFADGGDVLTLALRPDGDGFSAAFTVGVALDAGAT